MKRRSFFKSLVATGLVGSIDSAKASATLANAIAGSTVAAEQGHELPRQLHDQERSGIGRDFLDLDGLPNGFRRGDMIVLASRPAMPKSQLALKIAESHVLAEKQPVLIFSTEWCAKLVGRQMLASMTGIGIDRLGSNRLSDDDLRNIAHVEQLLSEPPLFIDDSSLLTVGLLIKKVRAIESSHGQLGLIVIDRIQNLCMSETNARDGGMQQVALALKSIAQSHNVPVLVLSELSRDLEDRDNKWPTLRDLPDSIAVANSADVVLLLYRDEVYNYTGKSPEVINIIVARNRYGANGVIGMKYQHGILGHTSILS